MQRQAAAAAQIPRRAHVFERQDLAGERVLQAQEPRPGIVEVVRLDRRGDAIERQRAVRLDLHRLGLDPPQRRRAAALGAVVVGGLAADVLVAAPAVREQREQVPLRAARYEQGRLVAEALRGHGFEPG